MKKNFIRSRVIVFKTQITQTKQKRKKCEKKIARGREIKKKLLTFDRLAILGDFGHIFPNISAPFHFFPFFSFLLSLCDLCGHFEYNKPRFYGNFFSKKN